MKYLVLVLLMSTFIIPVSYGQEPCEFKKKGIDEFTGKRTLVINSELERNMFGPISSIYFMSGEKMELALILSTNSFIIRGVTIKEGESMYIKLDNDSTIQLKSIGEFKESKIDLGTAVVYNIDPKYSVTKEDLKKIATGIVTKIRVVCSDKNYDIIVKPKSGKKILQALNCFLRELE